MQKTGQGGDTVLCLAPLSPRKLHRTQDRPAWGTISRERSDHTAATSRPGLLTAIFAPHSGCIRAVCPSAIPPAVHLLCPRLTLLCTPGARYRSQPTPTEWPPLGGRSSYAQQTLSVCRGSVTGSFVEAELCWRRSDAERLAVTSLLRRWTEISEAAACIAAYTRGAPAPRPSQGSKLSPPGCRSRSTNGRCAACRSLPVLVR